MDVEVLFRIKDNGKIIKSNLSFVFFIKLFFLVCSSCIGCLKINNLLVAFLALVLLLTLVLLPSHIVDISLLHQCCPSCIFIATILMQVMLPSLFFLVVFLALMWGIFSSQFLIFFVLVLAPSCWCCLSRASATFFMLVLPFFSHSCCSASHGLKYPLAQFLLVFFSNWCCFFHVSATFVFLVNMVPPPFMPYASWSSDLGAPKS